jgi:hypothetical protein
MERKITNIIESSVEEATGLVEHDPEMMQGGVSIHSWMVQAGDMLPPWWSKARDRQLSKIWRGFDHLATAIYNAQAKIVGIPLVVKPIDPNNVKHAEEAATISYLLDVTTDFGRSWQYTYSKFVLDLLTQDNGAFMEIIGPGRADGPMTGKPLTLRHLDASRCIRTGHPEFPVLYMSEDGKRYKIHWTRIIFSSQMPSSRDEMNGVGFCAVSRCLNIAQSLSDMVGYKLERLGSRPHNQMLVGKGVTGRQIMEALAMVESEASARGLSRYASTVAIGSENPDIDIARVDLTHMEPFDEATSTNLGMYIIAAAFGMDADELWPTSGGRGSSKGDAGLKKMRSRGRLPQQIIKDLVTQLNFKFLPPYLRLTADFQDDEQDMQRANVKDIRGRNRERDLTTGTIDIRTARVRMVQDEDVDRETFTEMELKDGRLPDGTPIELLFYAEDVILSRLLNGFLPEPLQIYEKILDKDGMIDDELVNDVIKKIQKQRSEIVREWSRTRSTAKVQRIKLAFWAVDWLQEQYELAAGRHLPPVPMSKRTSRTDIRVMPEEVSPPDGVSPARLNAASDNDENLGLEVQQ